MSDNMRSIARLMTSEEYSSLGNKENFKNLFENNGDFIATLKPLSRLPEKYNNVDRIICFCNRLFNTYSYGITVDEVLEKIKDKIIVFKPKLGNPDIQTWDQCLLPSNAYPLIKTNECYIGVPFFDLTKLNISISDFENNLSNYNQMNVTVAVSDEIGDKPQIIIVKHEDKYYLYSNINQIDVNKTNIAIKILDAKKNRTEFTSGEKAIIDETDNIVFLPESIVNDYKGKINILNTRVDINNISISKTTYSDFKNINNNSLDSDFCNLILKMKEIAKQKGLLYDEKDLINFCISVKSSNLVVLAGMSGTGKSQLVRVYAEALGMNNYDGMKFIPVSPAWTDDTDVLGYVDYRNMLYREADTRLISFLKEASKEDNVDKQYLICFDEMNLSRVEHYFSQFISILENNNIDRKLTVYNKNLDGKLYNSSTYPSTINIGNNIIFIGTVNVDESTFSFSDKILDRANIIKLKMLPFYNLKTTIIDCELTDRELDCLTELNSLIRTHNPKLGIGYRIISQINKYLNHIPENLDFNRKYAFDILIVQRVITKIRGSEDQVSALVGEVTEAGELVKSSIMKLLEKYTDVSDFANVKNELKMKAKELSLYGYTA